MTDTDMVEHVAEEIYETNRRKTAEPWSNPSWKDAYPYLREEFRDLARAAIRAMEERVTDDMLVAGRYQLDHAQRAPLLTAWRVMCRNALGEEKSGE